MKSINNFIQEKLNKINYKNAGISYSYEPSNYDELRDILKERLKEDKDQVSNSKIKEILANEQEHLSELQDFLNDIIEN